MSRLWSILLGEAPQWIVRPQYISDGTCLGLALQESLENGYKADYPTNYRTAAYILIIAKPCISCCRRTTRTRTCWVSRERVECRRQDPSNCVAVSAPRPLNLRCSDPQSPPALAAPAPAAASTEAPATATLPMAGKRASCSTGGK